MKQYDPVQFADGQRAYRDGLDCPSDASEAFKAGYGAQYELEQIQDAISGWGI